MAAPTNQLLPVLSISAPEPLADGASRRRFSDRVRQIGVRLYATAWFATAAISIGLGAYGTVATLSVYHQELASDLVAARGDWTLQVVPQTADPGSDPPTYRQLNADRAWFVDLERRKAAGYVPTAEEQAIMASWEAAYPFTPDTASAYGLPAIIAALAAVAVAGPIMLLSLLRWIATGRRGFGFRW